MENTTILLIGIAIIIILFSSFSVSYTRDGSTEPITDSQAAASISGALKTELNQSALVVGASKPDAATYAVYNLPEKDAYMTQTFRDQIDMLRASYYYFDEKMIQKWDKTVP